MKKINGTKVCFGLSVLLVIGFIINGVYDSFHLTFRMRKTGK